MKRLLLIPLLTLVALGAAAQSDDASNPTTAPAAPITKIRMVEVRVNVLGVGANAWIELHWHHDEPGRKFHHSDIQTITDGDAAVTTDDLVTGTGNNGEPIGLLRVIDGRAHCLSGACQQGADPAETGGDEVRLKKRVLNFLKANVPKYADITVN